MSVDLLVHYPAFLEIIDRHFAFFGNELHLRVAAHWVWLEVVVGFESLLKKSPTFSGPLDTEMLQWLDQARCFFSFMTKAVPDMYYPYMFSLVFEHLPILQEWMANPKLKDYVMSICNAQGTEHGNKETKSDMQHNNCGQDWMLFLVLRRDLQTLSMLEHEELLVLWNEFQKTHKWIKKIPTVQDIQDKQENLDVITQGYIKHIRAHRLGQDLPEPIRLVVQSISPEKRSRMKKVVDSALDEMDELDRHFVSEEDEELT